MYKLLLSDTKPLYDVLNGFEMVLCVAVSGAGEMVYNRGYGCVWGEFTLLKPIDLVGI